MADQKLDVQQVLDAGLDDWRRLATALHARYLTNGFDKLDLNQDGALQRLELELLVAFLNKQLGD